MKSCIIGIGLYGATYITPIFLGRVRGFSALDIGTTVFVTGIFMSLGAPLAARLSNLVDQRIVIAFGFSLFAFACWWFSFITPAWGFWEMFTPQAIRGFSILLCIVPSVGMALNGVPPAELRYASGLFNLMRNLGGAIGIAVATTLLQDFGRVHGERFGEALAHGNQSGLGAMVARMASHTADAVHAKMMISGEITQYITQQSLSMAFQTLFWRPLAALFVAGLIIVPFAKAAPVEAGAPPVEAH